MNTERDKFLTEAMGECYHDWLVEDYYYETEHTCNNCGITHYINQSFSWWGNFGKLITFLDNEFSDEEIADILYREAKSGCVTNLPDKVANRVTMILKERNK